MRTEYKKIVPSDVYITIFEREPEEAELWTGYVANDFGNRASGNDFVDVFAGIIRKYGHISMNECARMMKITREELSITMQTLSGVSALKWRDQYLMMACCELLEESEMRMTEISKRMGFTSAAVFSRFFYKASGFQPIEWRIYKRTGKRYIYHYNDREGGIPYQ